MKQEDKELIRFLRLQGWGYKRIAKKLRLNRNQVQLYCKTHGLAGAGEFVKLNLPIWYEQNDRCVICGEKLDRKHAAERSAFVPKSAEQNIPDSEKKKRRNRNDCKDENAGG